MWLHIAHVFERPSRRAILEVAAVVTADDVCIFFLDTRGIEGNRVVRRELGKIEIVTDGAPL